MEEEEELPYEKRKRRKNCFLLKDTTDLKAAANDNFKYREQKLSTMFLFIPSFST